MERVVERRGMRRWLDKASAAVAQLPNALTGQTFQSFQAVKDPQLEIAITELRIVNANLQRVADLLRDVSEQLRRR